MTRSPPAGDNGGERRVALTRRLLTSAIIALFLIAPAIGTVRQDHLPLAEQWVLLTGSVLLAALAWLLTGPPDNPGSRPVRWPVLMLVLAVGITLFVIGRQNSLAAAAVAAAACGRLSTSPRPAILASVALAAAGLFVALHERAGLASTMTLIVVLPMMAFFGYAAGRRADMVSALRRTRAELARAAVSEERLRIARDLHDLLGHSLSLITLKAELAGRVIGTDPARAAHEIADLEAVARQSLSDVREAVAGYRQPDLAGELTAAGSLLTAAGIASRIDAVPAGSLPPTVDAALAWAVREGITNVVRHSRADEVSICVQADATAVTAQICDNGPAASGARPAATPVALTAGPAGRAGQASPWPGGGSGLAGLAERVRSLGGELTAGAAEPRGFLLRAVIPLTPADATVVSRSPASGTIAR